MFGKVKKWLYRKNDEKKLFWLTSLLIFLKKHLSIATVYKVINPMRFSLYKLFRNYQEMELNENIKNGVFKIFIKKENGKIIIVKIPKKDNIFSLSLTKAIRKEIDFIKYRDLLMNLTQLSYIHENISPVLAVYKNGGYEAIYINGINLKDLGERYELFRHIISKEELYAAMATLFLNLEKYQEKYGGIEGDWAIQNLLFDLDSKKIVNVDLEGFFLYRGRQPETQLDFIKNQFATLAF